MGGQNGLKYPLPLPFATLMRRDSQSSAAERVDLNAAGKDELCSSLPGIGPVLADRIVAFRQGHGPFSDPTELCRVPGIGVRLAERLSDRVNVTPAPPPCVVDQDVERALQTARLPTFESGGAASSGFASESAPQSGVESRRGGGDDPACGDVIPLTAEPAPAVASTSALPQDEPPPPAEETSPVPPAVVAPELDAAAASRESRTSGVADFITLGSPSSPAAELSFSLAPSSSSSVGQSVTPLGEFLSLPFRNTVALRAAPEASVPTQPWLGPTAMASVSPLEAPLPPPEDRPAPPAEPPDEPTALSGAGAAPSAPVDPTPAGAGDSIVSQGDPPVAVVVGEPAAESKRYSRGRSKGETKAEGKGETKAENKGETRAEPKLEASAGATGLLAGDPPPASKPLTEEVGSMTVATPSPWPSRSDFLFTPKRRVVVAFAAAMGTMLGAIVAWQSDRKAAGITTASVAHVDHEVRALQVQEDQTREEVERQGAELAATRQALAAAVQAQKSAEAKAEARSAKVSQDVTDLAERTRRAQAHTDERVYRLDEAIKLIDWATTTGYAHQVVTESHADPSGKKPQAARP